MRHSPQTEQHLRPFLAFRYDLEVAWASDPQGADLSEFEHNSIHAVAAYTLHRAPVQCPLAWLAQLWLHGKQADVQEIWLSCCGFLGEDWGISWLERLIAYDHSARNSHMCNGARRAKDTDINMAILCGCPKQAMWFVVLGRYPRKPSCWCSTFPSTGTSPSRGFQLIMQRQR